MDYRDKYLERNDSVCEICGAEDDIVVHHIDGDRTNNSVGNLAALCRSCHSQVHQGEISGWSDQILDPIERPRRITVSMSPELNRKLEFIKSATGDNQDAEAIRSAVEYCWSDLDSKVEDLEHLVELKSRTGRSLGEVPAFTYENFLQLLDSIEEVMDDSQLSLEAKNRIAELLETDGMSLVHEAEYGLDINVDSRWPPAEYIASSGE